jgi:acyl-[acyl-carrier-protein] desaturase
MKNYKKKFQTKTNLPMEVREQSTSYGKRCLHCYEPLLNSESNFHEACNKRFFGQLKTPQLAYNLNELQELATRISHRNTGKLMKDEMGTAIMSRVGNDENLHYLFYRDLTSAALELDPSSTVLGIERAVRTFAMPGLGIPNFEALSREVAKAGIYDLLIHHDQILEPVIMRHWKLMELTGLSDEAEAARESIIKRMARTAKVGKRLSSEHATV